MERDGLTALPTGRRASCAPSRFSDIAAHAIALAYLAEIVGPWPYTVSWDTRYPLKGDAVVSGHQLVVIAPRDDRHCPIIVAVEEWEIIRRADAHERRMLLDRHAMSSTRGGQD